ncbi:MAG: hypothetical protein SAL07_24235 [Oscillatoria sp. PMC 1051.18]|nr:hypothetical protein [Oscillatoria sp. PMC 1050.18]MEC5033020.1 hypothetical protein [Oscillatoria sp. PMC 1051.18]
MNIGEALRGVKTIFLDTAPVIYFIEENPDFIDVVQSVINKLNAGELQAIISPVTFAECLAQSCLSKIAQQFHS